MQIPKFKTLEEKILSIPEEELAAMAKGRALAYADSSRLEGLILDQDHLEAELLKGYRELRAQRKSC